MSKAGWYPDPGGQPGMYRYWSGSAWSAAVTPNPPTTGPESPQYGPYQYGDQPNHFGGQINQPKRSNPLLWVLAAIGIVIIAVVATFILGKVLPGTNGDNGGGGTNPTQDICPKPKPIEAPKTHPADGYVHGGQLSYPLLPPPWGAPSTDDRVPFGRDVASQSIVIEGNYDNRGHSWVASVLVGELVAGDGFYSPQEGSEIVTKCLIGKFYGDAKVDRQDVVNKATTIQGKDAWIVETHLTFNIPNLKTKGETAIIVIVRTSEESSSLYYASIPDTSPQYLPEAKRLIDKLRVSR